MRANEFILETTTSGSIAVAVQPMGALSRNGGSLLTGKYVTGSDPTPNTPKEFKRKKRAGRQFENTISN